MKVAVPVSNGVLCMHFGHCDQFVVIDVEPQARKIKETKNVEPPPHEPGVLPKWLSDMGVDLIIAGGMGARAQQLFAQAGVRVVCGAPAVAPEKLVVDYLDGTLQTGDNMCDH